MDFRGGHTARVDEKGRLKLPADFKRTVDRLYGEDFFITSRDGTRAEIFPMKEWEGIEAQLKGRPSSAGKTSFMQWTGYYGQKVEFDAQGRLLLPQKIREKAGLNGDVAVLGMLTRIEVVNDERQQRSMEENPVTPEGMESLAIEGL